MASVPLVPAAPTGSVLDFGWALYQAQQQKQLGKLAAKTQIASAQSAAAIASYNAQAAAATAAAVNAKSAPPAKAEINWKLLAAGGAALLLGIALLVKR